MASPLPFNRLFRCHRNDFAVLLLAAGVLAVASGTASAYVIETYTDKHSYLPGETVTIYVSTNSPTYRIDLLRERWARQTLATFHNMPGAYHGTMYGNWETGANWPPAKTYTIPADWPTGAYLVKVRTEASDVRYAFFIVRPAVPGTRSRILCLMNYNTRNAYSRWGRKSLYWSGVYNDATHAVAVSFRRPDTNADGRGNGYWGQWGIQSHLEDAGFAPEYLTEWEVHSNPSVLRAYDVVVLAGHHEYISRQVYDALQAHHDRGGHIAVFSSNDLWWQVRYTEDGEKMIGYRDFAVAQDPMFGVNNALVTTLWGSALLSRPSEALLGISYQAGSSNFEPGDYFVQDASHWIFEGTGLENGQKFGDLLAKSETDYLAAFSPAQIDVLLYSYRPDPMPGYNSPFPYIETAATYYEDSPAYGFPYGRGGMVFASGTQTWAGGLFASAPDREIVQRVTSNIIQRMADTPPPPFLGDFNGDRFVTAADIADFVAVLLGVPNQPHHLEQADMNRDGFIDGNDVETFVNTLLVGP